MPCRLRLTASGFLSELWRHYTFHPIMTSRGLSSRPLSSEMVRCDKGCFQLFKYWQCPLPITWIRAYSHRLCLTKYNRDCQVLYMPACSAYGLCFEFSEFVHTNLLCSKTLSQKLYLRNFISDKYFTYCSGVKCYYNYNPVQKYIESLLLASLVYLDLVVEIR